MKSAKPQDKRQNIISSKKLNEILLVIKNMIKYEKALHVSQNNIVIESHKTLSKDIGKRFKTKSFKRDFLSFAKNNKQRFEFVTFIHYLNHVQNPKLLLKKTKKILFGKSTILVVVPNSKAIFKIKNNSRRHFSPRALRSLLNNAGFQILYLTTFEDYEDFKRRIKRQSWPLYLTISFFYFIFRRVIWSIRRGGYICAVASAK